MNYVKIGSMIFPEQAIVKFYPLMNRHGIQDLMLQDMSGSSYTLASGVSCNIQEYLAAQLQLLGWIDKSVPEMPAIETEFKTVKNGEEFTAAVNIPSGYSELEYNSSNNFVAMTELGGRIIATGIGYATISIYFKKPFRTLAKQIHLTVQPEQPIVNKTTKAIHIGEVASVRPRFIDGFSHTEWTSDRTEIASIDNDGHIIAKQTGQCILKGYYSSPYRAQVEEITLTVNPEPPTTKDEWINVPVGTSHQGLMPTSTIYSGTKWEVIQGQGIVDVNVNGAITGQKIGKAIVVGKYTTPYETEAVRYQINVIQPPEGEAVILSISAEPDSIKVGTNSVIAVQFSKQPVATPTLETDGYAFVEDALHTEGMIGHAIITGKKPGFATITVRVGTSSLIKKVSIVE